MHIDGQQQRLIQQQLYLIKSLLQYASQVRYDLKVLIRELQRIVNNAGILENDRQTLMKKLEPTEEMLTESFDEQAAEKYFKRFTVSLPRGSDREIL